MIAWPAGRIRPGWRAGAGTPVAVIESGTTERERVVETTLAGLAGVEVSAPAVIVVGEVVRLRRSEMQQTGGLVKAFQG
ncbi:MAG: hypothetical protein HY858_09540 [Candidatus Solibacter usitatus]|nr:hypothetical protein [Candidatus Solibacter usitatus]